MQEARALAHDAQTRIKEAIQAATPAEEAQEDKISSLLFLRLRASHEARKAKFKLAREKQHSATSIVSPQPCSLSHFPPPWSSDHSKEVSGASPASKQDEAFPQPKGLQIDTANPLTKLGSGMWSQSLSERLAMLERQDAKSAGAMFSQRMSARLTILEQEEEGLDSLELSSDGTKSCNHLHYTAQDSESNKASDHHGQQLQKLRLGIQGMLTKYEGYQSEQIATLQKGDARMKEIIVLNIDALAKAQTAHDEVLRKQAEAQVEVEAVTKERDELKEQLDQARKEQAVLIAKAKAVGAKGMFRRISGAGEWLLLASKGKVIQE